MKMNSDHDMSESSSPGQWDSPYSSPSQQVPQLANSMTVLTCTEDPAGASKANGPYLRIIEQPQDHFRFRYVSEMVGTHGCLLGKFYANNKTKTHPTVELVNYSGRALIRCCLVQHNIDEEHPHKLLEDEHQDRDVSHIVPEQGSYRVGFAGMGIIHTAKKDVPGLLYKKLSGKYGNAVDKNELKSRCESAARNINLNIVRLKFSAHDVDSGKEICRAVFSEPIHNMKSASTNDLKICRISRCSGRPKGGDDVFILVEKVNKKNIMIEFYEEVDGKVIWRDKGTFLQSDVHHQYAIVFRTPPYKDLKITSDVKVYMRLLRPSDGRSSEPKEFTYKADQMYRQIKKRKANSSYSSFESSSGGSIRSMSDLPTTVRQIANEMADQDNEDSMYTIQQIGVPAIPQPYTSPNQCGLANALGMDTVKMESPTDPMWSQSNVTQLSSLPILDFKSAEFEKIIQDPNMQPEDIHTFTEYASMLDNINSSISIQEMNFRLVGDSGRPKCQGSQPKNVASTSHGDVAMNVDAEKNIKDEYTAFYNSKDGAEVKQLVKDICQVIKNKKSRKTQEVRDKLERLLDIRLSNGDRFLHMTLLSNQSSFIYIVKMIHNVHMTHLLNLTNYSNQTILHLAVLHDMPKIVSLLVSKGCDPMIRDSEDQNVIQYAVKYQSCLEPLLEAIRKSNVNCDLNEDSAEPILHLATVYNSPASVKLLLKYGAHHQIRDNYGRTPLHLAAYDDLLDVMKILLEVTDLDDIDDIDGRGNTALQIVCGRTMKHNSLDMVKLLLEKKADPLKCEDHKASAWQLARDKPEMREIMKEYIPQDIFYEDDVKSEPEDEFESADESDMRETSLQELPMYVHELSTVMDATGSWRELACHLKLDYLIGWFEKQPSPALTLLNQIKECREMTSKSLAVILQDLGHESAALVIKSHID